MPNRDQRNNLFFRRGLSPVAATTDNTAYVSQIADVADYDSATFAILTGSLADADATFTVLVEHGDVSNLSDAAAVPDADLTNLETTASFTFAADDSVRSIGYVGNKRYVRVTITPANNTGNVFIAGVWVLGNAKFAPVANT